MIDIRTKPHAGRSTELPCSHLWLDMPEKQLRLAGPTAQGMSESPASILFVVPLLPPLHLYFARCVATASGHNGDVVEVSWGPPGGKMNPLISRKTAGDRGCRIWGIWVLSPARSIFTSTAASLPQVALQVAERSSWRRRRSWSGRTAHSVVVGTHS